MGKRSGVPSTDAEIAALTDEQLDYWIAWQRGRITLAPSALLAKLHSKTLRRLQKAKLAREGE